MVDHGDGACVVVRARESRVHGEGRQGTDRVVKMEEASMDLGDQTDEVWLLSVQRKLYQWSRTHPEESYRDLWNWIMDIRNLRCAWRRIAQNQGRRTAGIDGMTITGIRAGMGSELFLEQLQGDLRGDGISRVLLDGSLSQNRANRGSSDPSVSQPCATAWCNARSRTSWNRSSRPASGMYRTGFGPDEAARAPWSTSALACVRERRQRMADVCGHPINGSSKETSKAASTTSIITV